MEGGYLVSVVEDGHLMSSRQQLPCEVKAEERMATALRIDDQHRVRARALPCVTPRLCSLRTSLDRQLCAEEARRLPGVLGDMDAHCSTQMVQ